MIHAAFIKTILDRLLYAVAPLEARDPERHRAEVADDEDQQERPQVSPVALGHRRAPLPANSRISLMRPCSSRTTCFTALGRGRCRCAAATAATASATARSAS